MARAVNRKSGNWRAAGALGHDHHHYILKRTLPEINAGFLQTAAFMTHECEIARGNARRRSKCHEPKLRLESEIYLADRFQTTGRHKAVMAHRLRVAEMPLQPTRFVDSVRSPHAMH